MREITHEELKQIQLGILDKVHEFCEKNGITYFLSSGTLIGAVRHKGYIPWDDDLDLYMPRADYDKFIKLFSANSPENTKLLSLETDKKYQYPFAKVIDDRTEMVELAFGEKFKIGVYIDVFPVESVPDDLLKFVCWFALANMLSVATSMSARIEHFGIRWAIKDGSFIKKIFRIFLFPILVTFSRRGWLLAYDAFVKKTKGRKYVYNMSTGIGFQGCFRRSAISDSVDIEFEGKKYKTMSGYREYLHVTYGDYMQLPPPEKRVSNHSFKAWWKE